MGTVGALHRKQGAEFSNQRASLVPRSPVRHAHVYGVLQYHCKYSYVLEHRNIDNTPRTPRTRVSVGCRETLSGSDGAETAKRARPEARRTRCLSAFEVRRIIRLRSSARLRAHPLNAGIAGGVRSPACALSHSNMAGILTPNSITDFYTSATATSIKTPKVVQVLKVRMFHDALSLVRHPPCLLLMQCCCCSL
jgi:hypothetical protein